MYQSENLYINFYLKNFCPYLAIKYALQTKGKLGEEQEDGLHTQGGIAYLQRMGDP